jgi:glycosyltransferase involved in cell wall biosynthesis
VKKFLVFVDVYDSFTSKYLNNLLESLLKEHEVFLYSPTPFPDCKIDTILDVELEYFIKSGNHKVYDKFFNFISINDFDGIIVPRIRYMEYFLLNIISSKLDHLSFAIGVFGLNNLNSNQIRRNLLNYSFNRQKNLRFIVHTNDWYETYNSNLIIDFLGSDRYAERIKLTSDPIYDNRRDYLFDKVYAREKLELRNDKKYILFFGNPNYGKGLNLILEKIDSLPKNYSLLISSNLKSSNFDLNSLVLDHDQLVLIDRFVNEEEAGLIFSAVDIVCLPYRFSYSYGTSGVLVQAALAGKPLLSSKIIPFKSVIDRFQVGKCIDFEIDDFEKIVLEIDKSLDKVEYKENWNQYLAKFHTWDELVRLYMN